MTILAIVAPATIIGLMFGALSVCKRGKELSEDPEYLKKVQEGLFANSEKAKAIGVDGGSTFSAKLSVVIFLVTAALSVKITFATLSVLHGVVKHAIFAGVYR